MDIWFDTYNLSDKAQPNAKDAAHTKFQEIAFAYAILSDERRRKRYDTTGNTSESLDLEDDDFNWSDFFRAQWADTVTSSTIGSFKERYQGSDEERGDVLTSYTRAKGKLNSVFSQVMLSNPLHDEDRFREYIDRAIKEGEAEAYDAYTKETQKQRNQRQAKAKRDAKEAEEYAKKLGKYDSIFGNGASTASNKGSKDKGPDLTEMIQQRQKGRADAFLDDLEARYAAPKKAGAKSQKKRKRKVEEPPEELFQRDRPKKRKATKPEIYDEDEEEVDLENDTPVSEDEDDDDVKRVKARKRAASGSKGKKKGTAQKQ